MVNISKLYRGDFCKLLGTLSHYVVLSHAVFKTFKQYKDTCLACHLKLRLVRWNAWLKLGHQDKILEFMNKYHLRGVNQTLVEQIVQGLFKHSD